MSTYMRVFEHIEQNRLKGQCLIQKEKELNKKIVESVKICFERIKKELEETS